MALVSQGWELTVTLRDSGWDTVQKRFAMNPAVIADYADAATQAADIVAKLDAITDCAIVNYRLAEVYLDEAVSGGGNEASRALIVARIAGSPVKTWNMEIPGASQGVFLSATPGEDYDTVDTADADLVAFMAKFVGTAATSYFHVSDGEASGSMLYGKRINKKSRN